MATAREVFTDLCNFYRAHEQGEQYTLSKAFECEKRDVPDSGMDVISHEEYITDDGKVVVIYTSYDHSRTFELRPDSNHFDIKLYNNDGRKVDAAYYVVWDKM